MYAGGLSTAVFSPSGRVVARVESIVCEMPLPTPESQKPVVLPSGATVTKAVVIRNRLIITLSLITPARRRRMAEVPGDATAGGGNDAEDRDDDDGEEDAAVGEPTWLRARP